MTMRRGARYLDAMGGVNVGGVLLANPFMTASGTSGNDVELSGYMPMGRLGAVVVKSLFHEPWPGNPSPRVHVAASGMMNAVGLQGPGVVSWIHESLPKLESEGVTVVASIWGRTVHEYVLAAEQLVAAGDRICAIEVNLSCPNLEGRSGIIAHDVSLAGQIISAVCARSQVPVWAKLSANTDRIVEVATTVSDAGASAVTVIARGLTVKICDTSLAGETFASPIWFALITHVPTPNREIVLPDVPDVVQTDCEADVKTTVREAEEVALTVNVSAE